MNYIISKHTRKVYNYHPQNKDELKKLVNKLIKERGNKADLNDIDTSPITNMSLLFSFSDFNGNISNWDVSNVKDMSYMFAHSKFDGDISSWDISNVINMSGIFVDSKLQNNQPTWYKQLNYLFQFK